MFIWSPSRWTPNSRSFDKESVKHLVLSVDPDNFLDHISLIHPASVKLLLVNKNEINIHADTKIFPLKGESREICDFWFLKQKFPTASCFTPISATAYDANRRGIRVPNRLSGVMETNESKNTLRYKFFNLLLEMGLHWYSSLVLGFGLIISLNTAGSSVSRVFDNMKR
jgi:hypothetical protein